MGRSCHATECGLKGVLENRLFFDHCGYLCLPEVSKSDVLVYLQAFER
jgi:hypothetical protein